MRTFGVVVFGLVFIVAFVAVLMAHSVIGYPLSVSAVGDTARDAGLHGMLMDAARLGMEEVVQQSELPGLAREMVGGLDEALREAIPEDWFYDTFETAYGGFVVWVEGGDDTTKIDLTDQKKRLRAWLDGLATKYAAGAERDRARAELDEALAVVPDSVNTRWMIDRMSGDAPSESELQELRQNLARFRLARWIGFGVLLVLLVLIALIAMSSPKRLMVSVGLVLLLAGGLSVATSLVAVEFAVPELTAELRHDSGEGTPAEEVGRKAGLKVVEAMAHDALTRSVGIAAGAAGLGLLLFVGGLFARGVSAPPAGPSAREMYGAR